jgi:hypothetical protein
MQRPGLYFPYVHIRDDNWLKVAALYWPSVRRLLPDDYHRRDSPTARVFLDAEILRNEDHRAQLHALEPQLLDALRNDEARLVREYGLARAYADWDGQTDWDDRPLHLNYPLRPTTPALAWIHVSRVPFTVAQRLSMLGLARHGHEGEDLGHIGPQVDWLGMHPKLAAAYLGTVAARVCEANRYQPVTDQVEPAVPAPSTELGASTRLLLGAEDRGIEEGTDLYVMLALRYAVPANLEQVDPATIIECRTELAEELQHFRDHVAVQQEELTELASIPERRRRLEAFAEHVEQRVEVPLRALEKGLRLHKLEPTRSLLLAGSFAPPAAVSAALATAGALNPAIATAVGAVAAIGTAWWQVGNIRAAAKAASPVGYLLDVRDRLTPTGLVDRVRGIYTGTPSRG